MATLSLGALGLPASAKPGESPSSNRYRTLGKTGLRISDISFGTGAGADSEVVRYAYDQGVRLFDTAESYPLGNGGAAEAGGHRAPGPDDRLPHHLLGGRSAVHRHRHRGAPLPADPRGPEAAVRDPRAERYRGLRNRRPGASPGARCACAYASFFLHTKGPMARTSILVRR